MNTATKVCGQKKRRKATWMNEEVPRLVEEKKVAFERWLAAQDEYKVANRKCVKATKMAKKEF